MLSTATALAEMARDGSCMPWRSSRGETVTYRRGTLIVESDEHIDEPFSAREFLAEFGDRTWRRMTTEELS